MPSWWWQWRRWYHPAWSQSSWWWRWWLAPYWWWAWPPCWSGRWRGQPSSWELHLGNVLFRQGVLVLGGGDVGSLVLLELGLLDDWGGGGGGLLVGHALGFWIQLDIYLECTTFNYRARGIFFIPYFCLLNYFIFIIICVTIPLCLVINFFPTAWSFEGVLAFWVFSIYIEKFGFGDVLLASMYLWFFWYYFFTLG